MSKRGVFAVGVFLGVWACGCAASTTPPPETKASPSSMSDAPVAPGQEAQAGLAGQKGPDDANAPRLPNASPPEPALLTPEDAKDALARAEADLGSILRARDEKKAEAALSQSGGDQTREGSACDGACRAFGSMQRAAARLCELAGASEPRCVDANERLGRARERVAAACPACDSARQ